MKSFKTKLNLPFELSLGLNVIYTLVFLGCFTFCGVYPYPFYGDVSFEGLARLAWVVDLQVLDTKLP